MAKMFLCIGGPYDGQRKWWTEVHRDYAQYNTSGEGDESAVMVYRKLVDTPKTPRQRITIDLQEEREI
jgi:hypothetical protein